VEPLVVKTIEPGSWQGFGIPLSGGGPPVELLVDVALVLLALALVLVEVVLALVLVEVWLDEVWLDEDEPPADMPEEVTGPLLEQAGVRRAAPRKRSGVCCMIHA